jgi:uncharacterized transporter YbjL
MKETSLDRFGVQLNNDPSICIYIFILLRCFTGGKTCFFTFRYTGIRFSLFALLVWVKQSLYRPGVAQKVPGS